MKKFSGFVIGILTVLQLSAQKPVLRLTQTEPSVSYRGMSAVDDSICWIAGTRGTVCVSTDGAVHFECVSVPGFDSADFRSVYAFDAQTALICNTGSPAKILRTTDSGKTWKEVYSNDHEAAFLDGIDFWDAMSGIAHGDPIDGRMLILYTEDGGITWTEADEETRPQLAEGEACFAASGTVIHCAGTSTVRIASGGIASRLFTSEDKGRSWNWVPTPIVQGLHSTGIFSFAFRDAQNGIIVGGNYKEESQAKDHVFLTNDGGNNWQVPSTPTGGYRECVTYVTDREVIATGPLGADISYNAGLSWQPFETGAAFHVSRKARNGNAVFLAGKNGVVGTLKK
jgi:photosystem II stability/assembly factor-like uncharacterized protein